MTGQWLHWECPDCDRTNNAPAVKVEAMHAMGLDTIALICANPRCDDGVAELSDIEYQIKDERREPWVRGGQ